MNIPPRLYCSSLLALSAFLAPISGLLAQTSLTWDGGGANDNWSNASNWSPDAAVGGNSVTFGDTGRGTWAVIGNYVEASTTVESLTYRNIITNAVVAPGLSDSSNNWQVTNINSGVTLTISATGAAPTNILTVGRDESGPFISNAKIRGAGSLVVDEAASNISVNNPTNSSSVVGYSILDMSELESFTADVNRIEVGTRSATLANAKSLGTMKLAVDNTITANSIIVGSTEGVANGTGTANISSLQLGHSNTIKVDNIFIGAASGTIQNRSSGELVFQVPAPGPTPTVNIRAKDGISRANLTVGKTGASSGTGISGSVNFVGGTVDALLDNLIIGSSVTASVTGALSMDAGIIDALTVRLGYTGTTGSAGQLTGSLNVGGGIFNASSMILAASQGTNNQPVTGNLNVSGGQVNIANNLTMGSRDSSSFVGALIANVNITGGVLTVGGNIIEGTNPNSLTSTITLQGGTLDVTSGTIANLTAFNARSGTLKDLAQYNSGTSNITKTTSGTLKLEGTNAYSGQTIVAEGTLLINGTLSNSAVTVQSGAILGGSGTVAQSVTVQNGATLAPGNSPGTLSTGNINLASGADLSMELNGLSAGTQYDQVIATGIVNLNSDSGAGADLVLSLGFAPTIVGQTFTLIANDGVDPLVGAFATINGAAFGVGNTFTLTYNSVAYGFQLFYDGNGPLTSGGNDLVLEVVAVPEPHTALLAMAGLAVVIGFRRPARR